MNPDEDEMLASLKSRARNQVRAAARSGILVTRVDFTEENTTTMLGLIAATASRSGAFFRSRDYLTRVWETFDRANSARLYFAFHEGTVLAGAVVLSFGDRAWYKDGGSIRSHGNMYAPRYLHWQIMCDLARDGLAFYELGNIPNPAHAEASPMRGLYTFKTGFARETVEYMPTYELPLSRAHPLWARGESFYLSAYSRLRHDFWY